MEPKYSKKYILEFLRILKKDGLLIFQMPSEPAKTINGFVVRIVPKFLANLYRRIKYGLEMYAIKKDRIEKFIKDNKAVIIHQEQNNGAGPNWISFSYYIRK